MSHASGTVIIGSVLHIFDPNEAEYEGVRDHFSAGELAEVDRIRALPETHHFTIAEKGFVSYVVGKAVFTGA